MLLRDLIIDKVIKYPELYNLSHKDYVDDVKKGEIFQQIAEDIDKSYPQFHLDGVTIKNAWLKLVQLYKDNRNRNTSLPSGSGAPSPLTPEMQDTMEKLSFLDSRMNHRPVKTSLSGAHSSIWRSSGIIQNTVPVAPASDIFYRTKKENKNVQFKSDMDKLLRSVNQCANSMATSLQNKKDHPDKYYQDMFLKYFSKLSN